MGLGSGFSRPVRLIRDLIVDRDRPDLGRLARVKEPRRFVWAILPHAARTFSSCIALLPGTVADAAAVAYLYCRMLDTYEDLVSCPDERDAALESFARRLETGEPAAPIRDAPVLDARDAAHLLLVERHALVDAAYAGLAPETRALVRDLVREMAEGMRWSSARFREQGGVLEDEEQITRYCRNVLGLPVLFTSRLIRWHATGSPELPAGAERDAMAVGEMIQLANVTRDIEKDLARGVGYHPGLRAELGRPAGGDGADPAREERIREVRAELMGMALSRIPAYRRLLDHFALPRWSLARASAVLMLLYTDRYYAGCAERTGKPRWTKRRSGVRLLLTALPAAWSRSWAARQIRRVETVTAPFARKSIGGREL